MLTETTLLKANIDTLLDLMVERIRLQKALDVRFDDREYRKLKAEIKLIQAEIDKRKHSRLQKDASPNDHLSQS